MDIINDNLHIFKSEAEELLTQLEEVVLQIENNSVDIDIINELFRIIHTIKGSSDMFGFKNVAKITHILETILDEAREGNIELDRELIDIILLTKDNVKILLDAPQDENIDIEDNELYKKLQKLLNEISNVDKQDEKELSFPEENVALEKITPPDFNNKIKEFEINFTPEASIFLTGADPAIMLDELNDLGSCKIEALTDSIPELETIKPEECYLKWKIHLNSRVSIQTIKDVFLFLDDDEYMIKEVESHPESLPEKKLDEPGVSITLQAKGKNNKETEKAVDTTNKTKHDQLNDTMRVPSARLDSLLNLVGEMVITQARLTDSAINSDMKAVKNTIEEMERLIADIRDNVLTIRMMPIGSTFSRFKRLVRDLSLELGKDIKLKTEGAETELDKSILDKLNEPLVHLIRNCIDHGIEPPEERIALGKEKTGIIQLSAQHRGAHVIITIKDNGRGLDVNAIRTKAKKEGLISADEELTENQIFQQIFAPGFSTSKEISNISGRGVGMNVVKHMIEGLRGTVNITSKKGEGASIALSLPLTLAIIEGLLVSIDSNLYIIPLSAVKKCVEITKEERIKHNARNLISIHGDQIPYIQLRKIFNIETERNELEYVVIVELEDKMMGIVVDKVLGNHQTVIKSLGKLYSDIDVISGGTIMGDGKVALILDIVGLQRA